MKLFIYLLAILGFFSTISAKQKVETYNTMQQSLFYPNKGQIIDQDRKVRKDVNYHYSAPGFSLSMMERGMSWTVTKAERFERKSKDLNTPSLAKAGATPLREGNLDSLIFHTHRMDIEFVKCNPNIQSEVAETSDFYQNYFTEYTGQNGVTNVHGSKQVTLKNVWNKIDIVFHAKEEGKVEYDFIVHPGGNIKDIQLKYKSDGMDQNLVSSAKIIYKTNLGEVEETIPASYLAVSKKSVEVGYERKDDVLGFSASGLGELKEDLVIDSSLVWSVSTLGAANIIPKEIKSDKFGNAYVGGETYSQTNIATSGVFQTSKNTDDDVFFYKI
jgi:hypothetical protein